MSKEVTKLINKLHFLSAKFHMFHWNVHGKDFLSYHALFEASYKQLIDQKDMMAEYLRVNKTVVVLDFTEISAMAKSFKMPSKAEDMLKEALADYKSLLKDYEKIKPDKVLEALISEILPEVSKKIYLIESILI